MTNKRELAKILDTQFCMVLSELEEFNGLEVEAVDNLLNTLKSDSANYIIGGDPLLKVNYCKDDTFFVSTEHNPDVPSLPEVLDWTNTSAYVCLMLSEEEEDARQYVRFLNSNI